MEWFRQFQCQVINAQWEALKESRQRRPRTSIEEAVAAYREFAAAEYARSGTPRPASVKSNVNALLNISDRVGARMVDELTPQAISRFVDAYVGSSSSDRLRTSAWSFVAQAHSVFAAWTRVYWSEARLPIPWDNLAAWPRKRQRTTSGYMRPPEPLRRRTVEWYNGLVERDPQLWCAATLMMQFAMRPIDACSLTWEAFQRAPGGSGWILRYVPSKTRGRTSTPRPVVWPCSDAVYDLLKRYGGSTLVLAAPTPTERYDLYQDGVNAAMRELGWDRERYAKACYELRKMCVDAVYRKFGLERAIQISGDNPQTILHYYADPNVTGFGAVDVTAIV